MHLTSRPLAFAVQMLLIFGALAGLMTGAAANEGTAGGRAVTLIHNVYELQNISLDLNGSYALANDIDARATEGWNGGEGFSPLGDFNTEFNGSFEGRGHAITGLYIKGSFSTSQYRTGLFGQIGSRTNVTNLRMETIYVYGYQYVGGIAGFVNFGSIFNCSVTGYVRGESDVGGLAGYSQVANIMNCHNNASVIGRHDVGGIIGFNAYRTTISGSYNTGPVSGDEYIGGLCGYNWANITDCYSTGPVRGGLYEGGTNIGGLVGCSIDAAHIANSYSTGKVIGGSERYGGLVGLSDNGTVTGCYWDVLTSGMDKSSGGTGKSTAEMLMGSNFAGWDFENVWDIIDNRTYPFLRSAPTPQRPVGVPLQWADAPDDSHLASGDRYQYVANATDVDPGDTVHYGLELAGAMDRAKEGYDNFNGEMLDSRWTAWSEAGSCATAHNRMLALDVKAIHYSRYVYNVYVNSTQSSDSVIADLASFESNASAWSSMVRLYQDANNSVGLGLQVDPDAWGTASPVIVCSCTENGYNRLFFLGTAQPGPYNFAIRYLGGIAYFYQSGRLVATEAVTLSNARLQLAASISIGYGNQTLDARWDNVARMNESLLLPAGMTIGLHTGEILWEDPSSGNYSFNLTASDGHFWILHGFVLTVGENGTPQPRNTVITSPMNGTEVSGTVNITVEVMSCNCVGVTKLYIDGVFTGNGTAYPGNHDGFENFYHNWDSSAVGNGWHNMTVIGKHEEYSDTILVLVNNSGQPVRSPKITSISVPDNVTVSPSKALTLSVEASSPSGANLTYEWKENGVTLSTERSFTSRFSPGKHTLILLIGDGRYTTTRTFNFTVAQPPRNIDTNPAWVPGFGAGIAAAAVVAVVALGLFWRRERR